MPQKGAVHLSAGVPTPAPASCALRAGNPDTGCMCADAAAILEQAARVCNGKGSCALLAAPRGLVLVDDFCSGAEGCDYLCPNDEGACAGTATEAVIQYRQATLKGRAGSLSGHLVCIWAALCAHA